MGIKKITVMKKSTLFLTAALALGTTFSQAQDSKELKALSKKHNEFTSGKIYAKGEKVAILGSNLRFRVASRAAETTSRKAATTTKFESFASLAGITEDHLQNITNKYHKMVEDKFKNFGLSLVSYEDIKKTKGFENLVEKRTKERENSRANWGVAQIYTNDNNEYLDWKHMSPVGPHAKVAKELKAILYTSLITVDFCFIDMTASSTKSRSGSYSHIYTEGTAQVTPAINIHGYTYGLDGIKIMEDNTYALGFDDKGKAFNTYLNYGGHTIVSDIDYADKVEKCASCVPEFAAKRFKLMSNGLGTIQITANPEKFEAAVLDALGKYLNEVFALYNTQKK